MATRPKPITAAMPGSYEIVSANFADSRIPSMVKSFGKEYCDYGDRNDYPEYLLHLLNKSAKHSAIINGKNTYIFGNGFKAANDTPQAAFFLNKANERQSWNEIGKVASLDIEASGGFYLQVIPKMGGVGYNYYHVPFKYMRTNESESTFYYRKDWQKFSEVANVYPKFYPGIKEAAIFFYKEYNANGGVYPLPSWVACCNWVESDIEVSKHTLTNAKSGFSASKFINFYDGEPDERKKNSITKRMENAATGAEGKKLLIGFNNDPSKRPTIDDLGTSDLTKEDFTTVDNLITNNIFSGHSITHPLLFGIQQEGKLGSASELKTAFEIFKNTYCNAKQRNLESVVNYFAKIEGVQDEIKIVDIQAISDQVNLVDFKELIPKDWILEKLGIDATKYTTVEQAAEVANATTTNSVMTNLTGRQMQQISRIVRQYTQEKLTKQQAALMLKNGFGFTDADVNAYLGIDDDPGTDDAAFTSQYNEVDVAEMFAEVGEARENFTVIKSKSYSEDDDEFQMGFKAQTELTETEAQVAELIKKTPSLTAMDIAVILKSSVDVVRGIISKMESDGVLSGLSGGIRKLLKPPAKSIRPEILVRYSYEKRAIAPGPELIPTSRPFCVKLINQDRLYSRQDIQKISERLGYSVFKRSGGFWGKNIQCRHEWRSQLVIKK